MENIINIRPHHFLCLPGYRGKGYDGQHKTSWDTISAELKQNPDTFVRVVEGQDDLCANCPNARGENGIRCNQRFLGQLDNKVKDMLNLSTNAVYTWQDIMNKTFNTFNKDKHQEVCGNCEWRKQGLCNDTFSKSSDNKHENNITNNKKRAA